MADIYVFWDNSNMFISAKNVAEIKEGVLARESVRLDFAKLMRLATASRNVIKAIAIGSIPPEQKSLWNRLARDTGIQIELLERGEQTGSEQGADQCLQVHMLRAGDDEKKPMIAVLLTGDGKGFEDGRGFLSDLHRLYDKGWGIEVLSWEHSCKPELKKFAQEKGVFISLDNYYNSITFREDGRLSNPVSLLSRKTAQPRESNIQILESQVAALKKQLENFQLNADKEKRKKDYGSKINRRKNKKN